MNSLRVFCLLWMLFTLGRCSCNSEPSPNDQLPAETQEGKNTFGCRVNGAVWLPRPSLSLYLPAGVDLSYDPGFDGGTMSLKAVTFYRHSDDQSILTKEYIDIGIDQMSKPGQYSLNKTDRAGIGDYALSTQKNPETATTYLQACSYDEVDDTRTGSLTITKLDLINHILSGRFEFTLTKKDSLSNCPSVVKVTDGRFDMKF